MQVGENVPGASSVGGESVEASEKASPKASAVAWIAGHHAVDMEMASERALLSGVATALDAFPAVKLPRNFEVRAALEQLSRRTLTFGGLKRLSTRRVRRTTNYACRL